MRSSKLSVAVLAGAAILTACDSDPAGPALQLDPTTTGNIVVRVQTDTSRTTTPVFINDAAGGTRLNLFRAGDTTLIASLTTPGTTAPAANRGQVRFFGLLPGIYVVRPSLRTFSTASSTSSLSAQTGDSIRLTIAAGQTDTTSILRVRLGASIAGTLLASWFDTTRANTVRFGGTLVTLQRETLPGNNVFADVQSLPTDATGAVTFAQAVNPVAGSASITTRFRMTFNPATAGLSTPIPDAPLFIASGGFVAADTGRLNTASRFTQTGTTPGTATNQSVAQTVTFSLPSQIAGRFFVDLDNSGTYDSTRVDSITVDSTISGVPFSSLKRRDERLRFGDTVVVQLRNDATAAASSRVVTTATLVPTGTGAVVGTAVALPTFTFSSLRSGRYRIWIDLNRSRINGARPTLSPQTLVTLTTSADRFVATAPAVGTFAGPLIPLRP